MKILLKIKFEYILIIAAILFTVLSLTSFILFKDPCNGDTFVANYNNYIICADKHDTPYIKDK